MYRGVITKFTVVLIEKGESCLKLHLHTAINRADLAYWCMLYTYEGNKMQSWENDAVFS